MAHIHEKYDYTTSAFIVHDNKVLLLLHKKLNMWLQPGGHVELDEDPIQALFREIEEETGLPENVLTIIETVKDRPLRHRTASKLLPIPFEMNVHSFGDTEHQHIDLCYLMQSTSNKIIVNPEESNQLSWCSAAEINTLEPAIHPETKALALFALETLGGI